MSEKHRGRLSRAAISAALTLVAAGLAVVGTSSPAHAVLDFVGQSADLSASGGAATLPRVGADNANNAVAVWVRDAKVQAAFRTPDGGFTQQNTDVDDVTGTAQPGLQLVVAPAGEAIAVWVNNGVLKTASRPAGVGQAFGTPVNVTANGHTAATPDLAIDSDGNVVVVWCDDDGNGNVQVRTKFRPASGSFPVGVGEALTGSGTPSDPQVVIDPSGDITFTWARLSGSDQRIEAARWNNVPNTAPENFESFLGLSEPGATKPEVAVDTAGNTLVVWIRNDGADDIVQGSLKVPTGAFPAQALNLSAAGADASSPEVAFDPLGNALVTWIRDDVVQATERPAGGNFAPLDDLSSDGTATGQQLLIDPLGNVTIVWSTGVGEALKVSNRPAGQEFIETLVTSAAPGHRFDDPHVAIDHGGLITVVWSRNEGATSVIDAAFAVSVTCLNQAATAIGTIGNDTITGTTGVDVIVAGPGDDTMNGLASPDRFCGGSGSDTVTYAERDEAVTANTSGGTGDDGGSSDGTAGGRDTISTDVENIVGGNGSDTLSGNSLANTLSGGPGNDVLNGMGGRDLLLGGTGTDAVTYAGRGDAISANVSGGSKDDGGSADGTAGNRDTIGTDVENLIGGNASDTLSGNSLANLLSGGPGNDTLNGKAGSDKLFGGTGLDTVTYAGRGDSINANVSGGSKDDGGSADGTAGNRDTIGTDVENLTGGNLGDILRGNSLANRLIGGPGADQLFGNGGNDILLAKDGVRDIRLDGGAGTDTGAFDSNDPARISVP